MCKVKSTSSWSAGVTLFAYMAVQRSWNLSESRNTSRSITPSATDLLIAMVGVTSILHSVKSRVPFLSNDPQEPLSLCEFRELFFFLQKFPRMHASPAPPKSNRVLQVQHLVKQN